MIFPGQKFTKTLCHYVVEEDVVTSSTSKQKLQRPVYSMPCECAYCAPLPSMSRDSEVQSAEVTDTEDTTTTVVQAENLQFRDGALSERLDMGDMSAGDFDADTDNLADLGGFLSRPVRIFNFTWAENTFTQTSFAPWNLYFNTAQIRKKLDNYGRIQCRLRLKFIVNASPFYFGSLRVCYFPLPDQRANYVNVVDQVPFSQAPGIYLEPQSMTTAEMTLPFLYQQNWLDATKILPFTRMGLVQILQYANLRSANGVAGTGVNVSVYAWAEDVKVMGPTTTLALQSDEYEDTDGPISGPATAVANVASRLTDVPVIGPFASATAIGAKGVASIARLFGYSNPPVIDDVRAFQPKTFHSFANVETRMPIDKLAVDPKNEVTISTKVAGVDEPDQLAFDQLLSKESFLIGTLFSGSDAIDKLLWSAQVNPAYTFPGGGYYTTNPVGYFSNMFKYWRGSLIYKFRFIKTKYHKGRVLISWDPTGGNVASADTETTNLTRIVDLEFEDEVEFEVPYKAIYPYLETIFVNGTISNGASPSYTFTPRTFNGAITLRVQNVLTGPAASPSIDILTYVRAGKDFVFAVPKDITEQFVAGDPAGVIQSAEVVDTAIDGNNTQVDAKISAITTGETLASLRPLLHRASLACVQVMGNPSTTPLTYVSGDEVISSNFYHRVPNGPGRLSDGYQIIGTNNWSYNTNHPIDWTLNCFVGYRGSTTLHFNAMSPNSFTNLQHLDAERRYITPMVNTGVGNQNGSTVNTNLGNSPGYFTFYTPTNSTSSWQSRGAAGMSLTNPQTQTALSVNVPQYSNSRFSMAFRTSRDQDYTNGTSVYDCVAIRAKYRAPSTAFSANSGWPTLEVYYAAGVDFQPVQFLCTPRLFLTTWGTPSS